MENLHTSNMTDSPFACTISTSFKHDLIKDILKSKFVNPKNKISDEAIELMSELTKVLVVEASLRAAHQATKENKATVKLEHVETTLPQLILDFS